MPTTLGTRLVLWLDAAKGVTSGAAVDGGGAAISGWADQSGMHNDAVDPVDAGPEPTLLANAIHGLPAVAFAGSTEFLMVPDAPTLHFGTDDLTAAVVVQHTSPASTGSRMFISKQTPGYPFTGLGLFGNWSSGFGAGAQLVYGSVAAVYAPDGGTLADGMPRLYVYHRTADKIELRINGASVAEASDLIDGGAIDLTNTAAIHIGGQGGASQTITGSIPEIAVIRGTLTNGELSSLEAYLLTKYGL